MSCAYSISDNCWVTGAFVASVSPATGGTGSLVYEICRSVDSTGGFAGCDVNLTLNGTTSYTVTGTHLPADGYRRAYYFLARDSAGVLGPWNSPRYVRVDRYPPTVSATNASATWYSSRTATLSAADATGGAGANSGLLAVRYRWNSALDSGCTAGTATSSGATLTAPTGDNILYLCARDNTGWVTQWSGQYRVSTPVTAPGPTTVSCAYAVSDDCWVTGDFAVSVSPATGGSGSLTYELCRSNDSPGGFAGCDASISLNSGTFFTITGTHLPSDGYRRAYYLLAHDSVGTYGPWNSPRYVRVDRYAPTLSATNASATWYSSRTATLSAADATGTAGANSGLAAIRYRWNSALDAGCTAGTATSSGTTLTAPTGDNILYLCARDNTGRVTQWNGQYRVSTPPTAPGPTTVSCAYSISDDCWVTGDFVISVTPATGGTGSLAYEICRSNDSTGGLAGCDMSLTLNGTTSYTVTGTHVPTDGYRRAYYFLARDSVGLLGPWNTPRYVRVDRYAPTVSATNASATWYSSRTATVSASDATGGASANSGLAAARYSWNTALDAGCTAGTATSSGTTLTAPTGDNILYLCARDNTGRVTQWNGQYRVSTPPTAPGPTTVSCPYSTVDDCWVTGDFVISVTPATGGTGSLVYEICRSNDSTGGLAGSDVKLTLNGTTSYTVTGTHVPTDGYRRAYYFLARDSVGLLGPWNTPRYVRVDRYPPMVGATNASDQWFSSRTATLSADDATGGVGANSGLVAVRYSWNAALDAGCTVGTATSSGTTLTAPAGDNILYLCARDNTGQVTQWNGQYRVSTPPPLGTVFHPTATCRAVDTRESDEGPLRPGVARWFTLDNCGVPLTAYAVAVNVTTVNTVGGVEINAFPGDLDPATSSVVAAGQAILQLATNGSGTLGVLGVFDSGSGQADLVLDVTGYYDLEDPGSNEDPGGDDSLSTLGQPDLPYDGDPELLDDPESYPPAAAGTDPSFGYDATEGPMDCKPRPYTGGLVIPIGVARKAPRYLSYNGKVQLLVGASADAACHFLYTNGNQMRDKCNSGPSLINLPDPDKRPSATTSYESVLPALNNYGFNKTRLWVALGWETDRENIPFLWDAQGGYWRLDLKNQDYFNRIRAVVSKAKELDMFVEVTFFAPFQGPKGGFNASPWSWTGNKAKAPDSAHGGQLTRAGFTSPSYSVIDDPRYGQPGAAGVEGAKNKRMREFQRKVIEWTVDELWCYDNVIWEIANEPEDQPVNPLHVANWQKSMIDIVREKDCPATTPPTEPECPVHLPALKRRHLIAVQPFTTLGADSFKGDARVSILNGHYTHILTDCKVTLLSPPGTDCLNTLPSPPGAKSRLDLGAIQLAQNNAKYAKVLGFNEGKITPLGDASGTRRHINGEVADGPDADDPDAEGPDAARAEAWEFVFDRGGIMDHWGYLSENGVPISTVQEIRGQLSALNTFVSGVISSVSLAKLKSSANPPGWIVNDTLNRYPKGAQSWDSTRSSQRYWAALQTDESAATGRLFLLYIHHSTRRCYDPKNPPEREFTAQGCDDDDDPNTLPGNKPGPYMALGGYDARVWTTPQSMRYRERFDVDLGPNPGTFDVFWLNPVDLTTVKQQAIAWKEPTCPDCVACSNPSASTPCTIGLNPNEGYDFDIVLKIVQRP